MRTRIAGAITVCLSSDPPRSTLSRARTVACLGQAVPPGNSPSRAVGDSEPIRAIIIRLEGRRIAAVLVLMGGPSSGDSFMGN